MAIRRAAFFAAVLLLSLSPVFGQNTTQHWTFNTDPPNHNSFPSDTATNAYGQPVGSAPGASHQATDGAHVGVLIIDPTDVAASFVEPNVKVSGSKEVFIRATYRQTGTDPLNPFVQSTDNVNGIASGDPVIGDPDADGYRQYAGGFTLGGCPDVKVLFHPPGEEVLVLDDLTISTICRPTGSPTLSEWGTILMTLLMSTVLTLSLVRRHAAAAGGAAGDVRVLAPSPVRLFVPHLLVRSLASTLVLAGLGLMVARSLVGPIPPTDVAGTLFSALILGYQVHLLVAHVRRRS